MRQITIDPVFEPTLVNVSGQVLLCDSQGRTIGLFSPLPDRPKVSDLQLEPPLSVAQAEELRRTQRTGKPLEEILQRLGL